MGAIEKEKVLEIFKFLEISSFWKFQALGKLEKQEWFNFEVGISIQQGYGKERNKEK